MNTKYIQSIKYHKHKVNDINKKIDLQVQEINKRKERIERYIEDTAMENGLLEVMANTLVQLKEELRKHKSILHTLTSRLKC